MAVLPKVNLVKLGPGMRFVKDMRGTSRDRGVNTAAVANIYSPNDLWAAINNSPFPYVLPGSNVPLEEVEGVHLDGGLAMLVARYSRPRPVFRPRYRSSTGGLVPVRWWTNPDGSSANPPTVLRLPTRRITYYQRSYSASTALGSWSDDYTGTINNASYTILGRTFAAYTLRFDGWDQTDYRSNAYQTIDTTWNFTYCNGGNFSSGPVGWEEADTSSVGTARKSYKTATWPSLP